ncbi:hypothetical protein COCHEDRAFT_58842, partial [Bipolaris maydis C5]
VRPKFIIFAAGKQVVPRIPLIPGIKRFKREYFHKARWNFNCIGGSPNDTTIPKLNNKAVGVVGTRVMATKLVPALQTSSK